MYAIVDLEHGHLDQLLDGTALERWGPELHRAYFSPGSRALCLLEKDHPVFAGGIVNLDWNRGEAWIVPTPFFRQHVRICYRLLRSNLPVLAKGFMRVQATCFEGVSASLFRNLRFNFEGNMRKFGPNGEDCSMWSRVFEP